MGKKPVIGLAGGIASGKSLAAQILKELGCGVIDADELNHRVLNRDDVRQKIKSWWGNDTYDADNQCDRSKLAKIVFSDVREKQRLEALTHPLISDLRNRMVRDFEADDSVAAIVLDVPLLFEVKLNEICDRIIFLEVDEATRKSRVQQIRGWAETELARRENLQNPLDTKRNQSDHIVENNSDISTLRRKLKETFGLLIASFSNQSSV